MDELTTPNALPGTDDVAAADGTNGAGSGPATEQVVEVKDLLKTVLNKDFPTNEAAIKSLQDTYNYVGSMGQKVKTLEEQNQDLAGKQISPELSTKVDLLEAQLHQANFYASNPDYNNPEAKALISKFGSNPEEVIKDEVFQKAFTAIKTATDMEQSKSILHSNPRLGQVQDKMTQAKESLTANNDKVAFDAATQAVMDAYDLK